MRRYCRRNGFDNALLLHERRLEVNGDVLMLLQVLLYIFFLLVRPVHQVAGIGMHEFEFIFGVS
jgi:hypothetical protein